MLTPGLPGWTVSLDHGLAYSATHGEIAGLGNGEARAAAEPDAPGFWVASRACFGTTGYTASGGSGRDRHQDNNRPRARAHPHTPPGEEERAAIAATAAAFATNVSTYDVVSTSPGPARSCAACATPRPTDTRNAQGATRMNRGSSSLPGLPAAGHPEQRQRHDPAYPHSGRGEVYRVHGDALPRGPDARPVAHGDRDHDALPAAAARGAPGRELPPALPPPARSAPPGPSR